MNPDQSFDENDATSSVDNQDIQSFGAQSGAYAADQLDHLEGLEVIRKRPELFIEDLNEVGLFRMVNEVLDNSLDEFGAGHGKKLRVEVENGGWISVEDWGRGIPLDVSPKHGIPAIELVFTKLYAGGKFNSGGYKTSAGLHGLGLKCLAALSEAVEVQVWRDGARHEFGLKDGVVTTPLTRLEDSDRTGTKK